MKLRYLLRFAIDGDLRFISHRDTICMFERVLVRGGLPLKYSEGFNPRIRLWLPLPRSVGTTADDEVLVFEVTEELETEPAQARLRERSPAGLHLHSLQPVESSAPLRPVRAHYQVALSEGGCRQGEANLQNGVDLEALGQAVKRFLGSSSWPIERVSRGHRGPKGRTVDLRPLVDELHLAKGCLRFALPVRQAGAAKPGEVLSALGLPAEQWGHRLRRTSVEWDPPLTA